MKKLVSLALAALLTVGLLTACEKTEIPAESGEIQTGTAPHEHTAPFDGTIRITADAGADGLRMMLATIKDQRAAGYDQPITIILEPGEYFFDETIVIDETLSDVTIESDGREARLIGGYRVTDWQADTFNGVDCLSAPVRNEDFIDFIVNGERADRTRWPAQGRLTVKEVADVGGRWDYGSDWFVVGDGDLPELRNPERVIVNFHHKWIDENSPIASYDHETGVLTMRYCTQFAIPEGDGYWLENVAEAFDAPGEWYAENGRVYYIPRDESITADTIAAYVPTTAKLFDIHGTTDSHVSGVAIRNLTLTVGKSDYISPLGRPERTEYSEYATDGQALYLADGFVSFRYADDCTVEGCDFTSYGLYGVNIDVGSHHIDVKHCLFYDGGAGGVKIAGTTSDHGADSTTHNTVADCTITHGGRCHNDGCGILMFYTSNNTIEHNEISDLYYSGISLGWGWAFYDDPTMHDNLITKNHIYDIGQGELSDLGGIYTMSSQPGTVISYNLIHDVTHETYGSRAFGLDACTAGVVIENNICYNYGTTALGNSMGENNIVRNNIFVAGDGGLFDDATMEKEHTLSFEHNIFVSEGKPLHDINRSTLAQKFVTSANNLVYERILDEPIGAIFSTDNKSWTLEQTQKFFGLEEGSIAADPGFADFDNHDFTLAEDSPALDVGFVPFDLSDVGPRK